MKKILSFTLTLALFSTLFVILTGCGKKAENQTLDPTLVADLQAAYNGESNASAKYKMYAEKAAEAGYKDVAALFRAASKAEGTHAARQGAVLKSYGIEPKAEIQLPAYVDVPTSLHDAIKGESYEASTMYPGFLADADAKNAPKKVQDAFRFALEAEKEHARMYTSALNSLEQWKNGGRTFYVCTVCGYTTDSKPTVCVLCASPFEKFELFQ